MDSLALVSISLVILVSFYFLRQWESRLPPGPTPFPIIGNLLHLGKSPHISLTNLSKTYGPLISLKLGSITTIVISSSKTAQEMFQKHDQPLSSRAIPDAVRTHNHSNLSMVFLPVASPLWRNLRKISVTHLFSNQRLDASEALRRQKVQQLIDHVDECCNSGRAVQIGLAAFTTVVNLVSNTFLSEDLASYDSKITREFKDYVWVGLEEAGRPNISDFFPAFGFMDLQGVRRRTDVNFERLVAVFDKILSQRLEIRASSKGHGHGHGHGDLLDTLLNISEEPGSDITLDVMRHLFVDLFIAGTDTSSSMLEWTMTELLHNPRTLETVQKELRQVLGDQRIIRESDISSLPYLQAVVKEIFRLHPPVPFLVPRKAKTDVELCGFIVPKNAQLLVNVWAIGRDPDTWSNPNSFMPERFLQSDIDVKGKDYELIPFGAGRRMCPGLSLGHRMVHVMLASLLQSFNWELEDGLEAKDINMNEKFGFTLQKAEPLKAIPIKF